MSLNENASIDTSQVRDVGGGGGGGGGFGRLPIPGGGGGVIGLVVLVLTVVGGLIGGNSLLGGGGSTDNGAGAPLSCGTENPNRLKDVKCRDALYVNSIQAYWQTAMPQTFGKPYQKAVTDYFDGSVNTGCGQADSGVGPFYCPTDDTVYLDTTFWNELATKFGATGEFAQPYVLAHEYGHHVQDLIGTEADVQNQMQRDPGNKNALSVKLELQADCYAGVWAKHAPETKDAQGQAIFTSVSAADIKAAVDAAGAVGDDTIQKKMGGGVDESAWTHGSSAQREQWFNTGYASGDAKSCNTFAAG